MTLDLSRHPCFSENSRHRYGRIHLPVAPKCNIQCNFCDRRFDCANESRPGVTSAVLSPHQALHYLQAVLEKAPRIAVVGIAGPGDPFANATQTLETLRLVREAYPEMLLCVATNGLALPPYIAELAKLAVSHVTLTVNAIDPEIGAAIYAWVRDGRFACRGREGAELLLKRQLESVAALKEHGITVKINTILIPGLNDHHVGAVAERMARLGADILNCVPLYPVAGTAFESIPSPSSTDVVRVRGEAARFLPQMRHCTRCRADAVGLLGESMSAECLGLLQQSAALPRNPNENRPYVAVGTREGMLVNQHLGKAEELAIFEKTANGFELRERRSTPLPGSGQRRWRDLAASLHDCRAVLVASAGSTPQSILTESGIQVVAMEGLIEEGLSAVFRGEALRAPLRCETRCGSGCGGNGMGCM